jgi:hypothetical protein
MHRLCANQGLPKAINAIHPINPNKNTPQYIPFENSAFSDILFLFIVVQNYIFFV